MKLLPFILIGIIVSCSSPGKENGGENIDSTSTTSVTKVEGDTTTGKEGVDSIKPPVKKIDPIEEKPKPVLKVYENKRFKDVTVEKIAANKYRITGKGQIFEAAFSWVVEDGHNELKEGHEMTDAGAPEWGNFNFVVEVAKKRPNSTLHIILFESSAKDGSRQHLLPIKLQ